MQPGTDKDATDCPLGHFFFGTWRSRLLLAGSIL